MAGSSSAGTKRHYSISCYDAVDRDEIISSKNKSAKILEFQSVNEILFDDVPDCTPPEEPKTTLAIMTNPGMGDMLDMLKYLKTSVDNLQEDNKQLKTSVKKLEDDNKQLKLTAEAHETKLQLHSGVLSSGYAVSIRFFVQYAFQIVDKYRKDNSKGKSGEGSSKANEKNSVTYKLYLQIEMPESISLTHTGLGTEVVTCNLKPFAENILMDHGRINGNLSNQNCHSSTLRNIAASIEGELSNIKDGFNGLLPENELNNLKDLFLEFFKVSTEDAIKGKGGDMVTKELKLPGSNRKY